MKTFLFLVLKFITLITGAVMAGILMVPTGVLVMMISVVWKTTDKLVARLEGKKCAE